MKKEHAYLKIAEYPLFKLAPRLQFYDFKSFYLDYLFKFKYTILQLQLIQHFIA